jgi:acyl-CoA thioester hydrolase
MTNSRDHCDLEIRVRYAETDRMGFLHHSHYPVYFEAGRTELLRQRGISYRDIEDQGFFLVVARMECKFKKPARYDDLLRLRTIVQRVTPVRIEHRYEVYRDEILLTEAASTIACVDRDGQLIPLPEILQ